MTRTERIEMFDKVERLGWQEIETIDAWVANEGLTTEDAISETAPYLGDLGAIFTALLTGGYIDEQEVFDLIEKGLKVYDHDIYAE